MRRIGKRKVYYSRDEIKSIKAEIIPTLEFYDQSERQKIAHALESRRNFEGKRKMRNLWLYWITERPPLYREKRQAATLGLGELCNFMLPTSQGGEIICTRKP
jgi:hypothetical protein